MTWSGTAVSFSRSVIYQTQGALGFNDGRSGLSQELNQWCLTKSVLGFNQELLTKDALSFNQGRSVL